MHLKRISVSNLFSFKNAEFPLSAYTVMVGPNNSGKTNLLRILGMMSKNENLEHLKINRECKFDPNKASEITFAMVLDKSEANMVFQCIFGLKSQISSVSKEMTALDITIFWGGDQMETMAPKLVLYRFGSGFTIAVSSSGKNIAFNIEGMFATPEEYEGMVNSWKAANPKNVFEPMIKRYRSSDYVSIENSQPFRDAILSGRFDASQCSVAIYLPMEIKYDPNEHTPIVSLIKNRKHQNPLTAIPTGVVLNGIFGVGFTWVREIYPDTKNLSDSLAEMRNSYSDRYADLRHAFKEISGGIDVLSERDSNDIEQVRFIEGDKKYDIGISASGYYALTSILYKLLARKSGLVAIDEPEIHLHPEMSSRLHNMLGKIACDGRVQIVVVTHSTKFVTYGQIQGTDKSNLIMLSRPDSASQVRTNTTESALPMKPHMFNPEIVFGRESMMVEGPSDHSVQRAISDFHGGVFEKCNIVLVDSGGKDALEAQCELHRRFNMPYRGMADEDYDGNMENVTRLKGDLEDNLKKMGVKNVKQKEDSLVYGKMMEFLKESKSEEWKNKSDIWLAFTKVVQEAGGMIPQTVNTQH